MTEYYDLSAANARIPELRPLLESLRQDRDTIAASQQGSGTPGDRGGNGEHGTDDESRQQLASIVRRMKSTVVQIDAWGITLRDIGTGLVDFPALANGRPIWLCWKLGEDDIAWWHELDAGIAGRKPLIELE